MNSKILLNDSVYEMINVGSVIIQISSEIRLAFDQCIG